MSDTALQQLPRLLAWLDKQLPPGLIADAAYQTEPDPPGTVTMCYAGLWADTVDDSGDSEIIILTDRVADATEAARYLRRLTPIAALRNMLPGLREMAEDYRDMAAIIAESGYDKPGLLLPTYERLAQRILDAARGVLTPEQYAEAVGNGD